MDQAPLWLTLLAGFGALNLLGLVAVGVVLAAQRMVALLDDDDDPTDRAGA